MSGVTYLLLTNPTAYQKLKEEVRTVFQSQEDIDLISVNKLPYMLACLDEAMRMYPPIANGLPRVCPEGGAKVVGEYVPANVSLIPCSYYMLMVSNSVFQDFCFCSSMGTLSTGRVFQGPQHIPSREIPR